jgi:L-fuculose-phosphate aldolase
MTSTEQDLRWALVEKARFMNASGLNKGTSGNLSVRHQDRMLITPSATPYEAMRPEHIALMRLDDRAEDGVFEGPLRPSTEWRFHRDILRARPEVNAVVHTHSTYATVLAITRRPIPAVHYMIAAFGGTDIRCGGYARYGTQALSDHAIAALAGRNGCLLANHGMIAIGPSLDKAMWLAGELETLAQQYYMASLVGGAVILDAAAIEETAAAFGSYGLQDRPAPGDNEAPRISRADAGMAAKGDPAVTSSRPFPVLPA